MSKNKYAFKNYTGVNTPFPFPLNYATTKRDTLWACAHPFRWSTAKYAPFLSVVKYF